MKYGFLGQFVAVVFCAIIYLLFSFGNWEDNPANWSEDARAGCAFLFSIAVLVSVAVGIISSIKDDTKK